MMFIYIFFFTKPGLFFVQDFDTNIFHLDGFITFDMQIRLISHMYCARNYEFLIITCLTLAKKSMNRFILGSVPKHIIFFISKYLQRYSVNTKVYLFKQFPQFHLRV